MKAKIIDSEATVYSGTGFSAIPIAELVAGSEVDILAAKKQDGQKWFSVTLADGQMGFLSGKTKFSADSTESISEWRGTEQKEAGKRIVRGACWLIGGVLAIAFMVMTINSAVSSRSEVEFPFKPVALLAVGAIFYGGFLLVGGIVEYMQSFRD